MSSKPWVEEPILPEDFAVAPWTDPVQVFFEGFEGFVCDPSELPARQFDRLTEEMGWPLHSPDHRQALSGLEKAQFRRFDPSYDEPGDTATVNGSYVEDDLTPAEMSFVLGRRTVSEHESPASDQTIDQQLASMSIQERGLQHVDAFFDGYPDFNRDRTNSVATQLNKLRKQQKWWGCRSDLWKLALLEYQYALVLQFNAAYGTDENDLETWRRLFARLPISDLPDTVDKYKSFARILHVNLVDLVDVSAEPEGKQVRVFESEEALSLYTSRMKKFFPRKHAYAGGLLSHLLRQIF